MKRNIRIRAAILLLALLILGPADFAPAQAPAAEPPLALPSTDRLPGVDLAEGVTQMTGVAISPLLGVSSVGAWRWFRADEAQRLTLPWFCHPYAWGTGFVLLGMCFLKDVVGTGAPVLIKKPLDFAELFEDKLSALVATGAFVPFITMEMARHFPTGSAEAAIPAASVFTASALPLQLAALPFNFWILLAPLCMILFLVVWLTSHSINVLIALSPLGIVDGILKLFKMALLSSVVITSMISPFLSAALSIVIIVVAAFLAPWAFRLTLFGTLMGLDILLPGRGRRKAVPASPHGFLARPFKNIPARTFGRISRSEDDKIHFAYHPWLILPRKTIAFPAEEIALYTGVIYPSLSRRPEDESRRHSTVLIFLPRYRAHTDAVAEHLAITDVRDSVLIKGFKAARTWIADTVSFGKAKFKELRAPESGIA